MRLAKVSRGYYSPYLRLAKVSRGYTALTCVWRKSVEDITALTCVWRKSVEDITALTCVWRKSVQNITALTCVWRKSVKDITALTCVWVTGSSFLRLLFLPLLLRFWLFWLHPASLYHLAPLHLSVGGHTMLTIIALRSQLLQTRMQPRRNNVLSYSIIIREELWLSGWGAR